MGDRVSISFKNGEDESVALFSHWGGEDFVKDAHKYALGLKFNYATKQGTTYPLGRLEPDTVMVDFIRHLTVGVDHVEGDYYLGCGPEDGDNSDNGHFTICLDEIKEGEELCLPA